MRFPVVVLGVLIYGMASILPKLKHLSSQVRGCRCLLSTYIICIYFDKYHKILEEVLENDVTLQYSGLVLNLPGSQNQDWHKDGDHLFPALSTQLPPHAFTLFIPLVPMTPDMGQPEFFIGSHENAVAKSLEEGATVDPPVSLGGKLGDIILFDYRIVHRGTANSNTAIKESLTKMKWLEGGGRPMLYSVFSKSWFKDTKNFGASSIFAS
eukprot:m.129158 g.129158  ORF g.129158 m.129158 type:complete len:210 (-) comp14572_c0_seq1:2568-3197(-)